MTREEIMKESWEEFTWIEKIQVGGYRGFKNLVNRGEQLAKDKGIDHEIAAEIAREEQMIDWARLIGTFIGVSVGFKILEKLGYGFVKK